MPNIPEIVEVDNTQLEEALHRAEEALDEKDAALIRAVFASYVYVTDLVEDKNTSIRRLRHLLFGTRTEKTDAVVGRRGEQREESPQRGVAAKTELAAGEADDSVLSEETTETAARGHGRNGADAYRGAERIVVPHLSLHAGDPCPACDRGNVYEKTPGVVVRISGQPPLTGRFTRCKKVLRFPIGKPGISALALSPHYRLAACVDAKEQGIYLLDLRTQQTLRQWSSLPGKKTECVAFSCEGHSAPATAV